MLELEHIQKAFDGVPVLKDLSLQVEDGEIVSILGPSGCGKTTLLNIILGIVDADQGEIRYNGEDLTRTPMEKRGFNIVFQDYALFPNLNVQQNITYGLRNKPGISSREEVDELIDLLGLREHLGKRIDQLSGGQKQRVAIARALSTSPKYLLCDEATSALDPNTTRSILELLRQINRDLGVTIIIITHEMKVIDQICDRVAVIDKSCIAEEGRVADVVTNPKSDIARELVLPQERPVLDPTTGGRKLRLIFNGEDTQKPVISEMILACRVPVNVLFADTKSVEGAAYGHMILELPNDEHDAEKVVSWLKNSGLTWKEER